MSIVHWSTYAIDEVDYLIEFIKSNIATYNLYELTNGGSGDIPSINSSNPLAMEYGNMLNSGDPDNYTSMLPAVGVEMLNSNGSSRQPLGEQTQFFEVTQQFIDTLSNIDLKDRLRSGVFISDSNIAALQDQLDANQSLPTPKKLFAKKELEIEQQQVNIAIWSQNPELSRYIYIAVKSLMKRYRKDVSVLGVKNLKMSVTGALYNYEFSQTLFGYEIQLDFLQYFGTFESNTDYNQINAVDLFAKDSLTNDPNINIIPGLKARSQ